MRKQCLACGAQFDSALPARTLPRCRHCIVTGKPIDAAFRWVTKRSASRTAR
jgi:hypothetical protein